MDRGQQNGHWDMDTDSNTAEPLPLDMNGNIRIIDTAVDLGAFEFAGVE